MKKSIAIAGVISFIAASALTGCDAVPALKTLESAMASGFSFSTHIEYGDPKEANSGMVPIITANEESVYDNKTNKTILQTHFETISLDESTAKRYPELNDALKKYSEDVLAVQKKAIDAIHDDPQAVINLDGGMFYNDSFYIDTVRTDDDVFSMVCYSSSFYGGPHPNYSRSAISFDSGTGKKIELTDVVRSKEELTPVLKELLLKKYPDASFYDLDKSLKDFETNPDYNLCWYLTHDGICVVFNPYDLTPYAEGGQVLEIPFKDYPSLFTGGYDAAHDAFVAPFSSFDSLDVDILRNGKTETISVSTEYDDQDECFKAVTVKCGDKSCSHEDYFFSYMAKLIHTNDNRNYVYVFTRGYSDVADIMVFDLNDGDVKYSGQIQASEPVRYTGDPGDPGTNPSGDKIYKSSDDTYPLTNPDGFWLQKRVDALSTYQIKQFYTIGSDGVPVTKDEFGDSMSSITLTAKKEFKAKAADIETNELKDDVTIKSGDKLEFYRTNGKDTVIFKTSDGSYVGVRYDQENKIDGVPAEELFESLFYAG